MTSSYANLAKCRVVTTPTSAMKEIIREEMGFMRNGRIRWPLVIASLMLFDVWGACVEDIAVGSVKWDYFALDGNLQRIRETGAVDTLNDVKTSSSSYTTDRYGNPHGALRTSASTAITFNDFSTLFSGSCELNGGSTLNETNYGAKKSSSGGLVEDHGQYYSRTYYYYYPSVPKSSYTLSYVSIGGILRTQRNPPELYASYSMWFKLDELPSTTQTLLSRKIKSYTYGWNYLSYTFTDYVAFSNRLFEVQVLGRDSVNSQCLKFEYYTSSASYTSSAKVTVGKWHNLIVVSTQSGAGSVYLDGIRVASGMPSGMQLGYFHGASDNRCWTNRFLAPEYEMEGSVDPNPVTLTIGKIPGAIDDIVFYHSSLTATQVKNLYDAGCPRPPSVGSITATPRYPWNGKVDLKFTIDGTSGTKYDTSFTAKDVAGGTNLTLKTLYKSNGTAANVAKEQLLPGTYNWVWDATADLGEGTVLERVAITVDVK